jgi:hypothetical protein
MGKKPIEFKIPIIKIHFWGYGISNLTKRITKWIKRIMGKK